MRQEPLASPYDIIPPPLPAFVPEWWWYLLLAGVTTAGLWAIHRLRPQAQQCGEPLSEALALLQAIDLSNAHEHSCDALSRALRRIVSILMRMPVDGLTADEIARSIKTSAELSEPVRESLQPLAVNITELELSRFSRSPSPEHLEVHRRNALQVIEAFINRTAQSAGGAK